MNRLVIVVLTVAFGACARPNIVRPFNASPITPATPVTASFDRTWDAAISWFASQNIAPRILDKNSGILIAEVDGRTIKNYQDLPAGVNARGTRYDQSLGYADCGARDGIAYPISKAVYNVHVENGAGSVAIQANVKYTQDGSGVGNSYFDCVSKGKWEREIREFVKLKAEATK